MRKRRKIWQDVVETARDRLREPVLWFPFPALLSFALVLVLIGQLIPGLNPRLGSRAGIIEFEAKRQPEGAIWVGVFPDKDKLIVTTSDRERFEWSLDVRELSELNEFIQYLKARTRKEGLSAGLLLKRSLIQTMVVLAVDERLKYVHVKPILYALAEAKITRYAFETRLRGGSAM